MTLLQLQGIERNVNGLAYLAGMDLSMAAGLNVLLGPTGSGKTSLLRLIAGLDRPSGGQILLDGKDITKKGVKDRPIAMVYQQFVNYPSFTIYENIASPLRQGKKKFTAGEIDHRVKKAAERMRIDGLLTRLPAELSGGQQQRTAIARALVKEARILLLDEPLVNLDYKLREELRTELRGLFQSSGTIVVYATTEPAEALLLSGSCAVLDKGMLLQAGKTLDVYRRPVCARVGEIFSDPPMNLLSCRLSGSLLELDREVKVERPRHMAGLAEGSYFLGIRANHIFTEPKAESIPLQAEVELAEIGGSQTYLHLRHGALQFVAELQGVYSYQLGAKVKIYLDRQRLYAFDVEQRLVGAPQ